MTVVALAPPPELPRRRFPSLRFGSRRVAALERRCARQQAELDSLRAAVGQHFAVLAGMITGAPATVTPESADRPLATVTDLSTWRAS